MCAFDSIRCIVAPASGISVTDVDPARAGLFEHAFDLIEDIAKMSDKQIEGRLQTKLPAPGSASYTEVGFLPFVSLLNGL